MGPGAYSPERAESITKTRSVNINMGSSPARTEARVESNAGPGQYDDRNYEISKSSKSFTIGVKREARAAEGMGPGSYSPERAESLTKTKTPNVDLGSSPGRPIVRDDSNVGPG